MSLVATGLFFATVLLAGPPPAVALAPPFPWAVQATVPAQSDSSRRAPAGTARTDSAAVPTTGASSDFPLESRLLFALLPLLLFSVATVYAGRGFLASMQDGGHLSLESHWGGFGGGGGGVRLSRSSSYLIALVFFAGLTAALALSVLGAKETTENPGAARPGPAPAAGSPSTAEHTSPPAVPGAAAP